MGLMEQLNQELKEAMREKDQVRKDTIRLVKAAVKNAEIERQHELDEGEILDIIGKQAKLRRDALDDFERAGRHDLKTQYEREIAILRKYLPTMMGRSEIKQMAQEVIAELGADSPQAMGQVMREMMARVRGQADGRLVNKVVRELLTEA